ncbi:MAG: hypothetical protein HY880_07410, partial [Deltaproteobacteria bacterium]|nr:hypothetical protein [Deltaproteobacteria bacterium]
MSGIMPPSASGNSNAAPQKSKVMIGIESFLLGFKVPFDVYSKDGSGYSCVLRKWTKFDQAIKDSLKAKGLMYLYVEGEPAQVKEFFTEKSAPAPSVVDNYTSYAKNKDAFHHVSKLVFSIGARVNFSIFNVVNMQFVPVLETSLDKFLPVTDTVRNANGDLAIKMSDVKLFREYLSGLSKGPTNDSTALQARVAGIKENVKMSVRDLLSDPGNAQN